MAAEPQTPPFVPPSVPGEEAGKKPLTEAEREQRRQASRAAAEARSSRAGRVPANMEARLREPLVKIGEWLAIRDPELGSVLVEDAPKIAALLAKAAESKKTPAGVISAIRLAAGALEPIDAFGRVLRLVFVRLLSLRRRGAEYVPEPVYGPEPEPPEPEPEEPAGRSPVEAFEQAHREGPTGVPDRFSVGYEPPPAD